MWKEGWIGFAYVSRHVDEAQPLADVVAYRHGVGVQEAPVVGAGGVEELQPVRLLLRADLDLEDEGLVMVTQHWYRVDVFTRAQAAIWQIRNCFS